MDSNAVVQFAELIRQSLAESGAQVQVWLGNVEEVRQGALPALLLDELCPACHCQQPHMLKFLGNWNQYICLVCGFRHSEQLVRQGGRSETCPNRMEADR